MNKPSVDRSTNEQDGRREALAEQAKHAATEVADQAREQVESRLETRKDKAVHAMDTVASAIRETGDKLKDVGPLGNVAERAAERLERAAHSFEGKSLGDVVRDVERVARREPALFLGAAFALGLLGGRFLKSSARRSASGGGRMSESAREQGSLGYERYESAYGGAYDEGTGDEGFLSDEELEADTSLYPASDDDESGGSV